MNRHAWRIRNAGGWVTKRNMDDFQAWVDSQPPIPQEIDPVDQAPLDPESPPPPVSPQENIPKHPAPPSSQPGSINSTETAAVAGAQSLPGPPGLVTVFEELFDRLIETLDSLVLPRGGEAALAPEVMLLKELTVSS